MLTISKDDLPILHLLAYPYVHFRLNDADFQNALPAPNYFLINIDADKRLWLVVRRHDDAILLHEIVYRQQQGYQQYFIGDMTPQVKLEHVLEIAMKQFQEYPEIGIPIETAVFRRCSIGSARLSSLTGKFGFGFPASVDVASFGFAGTFFVRALDSRLAARANFDDLEKLVSVRHENVCAVLDYYREFWVIVLTEKCKVSLEQHMDANQPFSTSSYVLWLYQFFNGLQYLLSRDFICERLSIRSLLLSSGGTVKVSDFWPTKFQLGETLPWLSHPVPDVWTLLPGTRIHLDLWRTTPPEILKSQTFTHKAFSYSFGAVAWQIFTHNLLPFRYMFPSSEDFLFARPTTDDAFFPGMDLKEDFNHRSWQIKKAISGAAQTFKALPAVPEELRKTLCQCLLYDPSERPSMADISPIMARAHRTYAIIHKVDTLFKYFRMSE